jgi:hypothetical protein
LYRSAKSRENACVFKNTLEAPYPHLTRTLPGQIPGKVGVRCG